MGLLVLVVQQAHSYPVTRIDFQGNQRLSASRLAESLTLANAELRTRDFSSRAELLLAVQHAQDILHEAYLNEGYLLASIDSFHLGLTVPVDSSQGYQATFYVTERARYTLASLTITGAHVISEADIKLRMRTSVGSILDERTLERDITELLQVYEQQGYPLARVTVRSITPRPDTTGGEAGLDVALEVQEGQRARIGKILVTGNTTTDPSVVTRELHLQAGSLYNAEEVERARARVERLGFFESVSRPELYLQGDSLVALVIAVKEANTSAVDGVLGYNPARNSSESGYISGLVSLSFRNISGTGRNAALHYDRETRESQLLEVLYLEPWIFGYPFNIGVGFLQRQQDTTYTRTAITSNLALTISQDIQLIGALALDRVIPTDQPDLPFTTYDSRTLTTGLSAMTDTRNNSIAPTYGVLGLLGASYGVKSIYGPGRFIDSVTPVSIGLRTLFLDASGYHSLFTPRVVAAIGLHARSVAAFGGSLDASDLFRVGGFYSLRGYRERELLASRYAYANAELRIMTGTLSYLFVFLDGGYLFKDGTRWDTVEQVQYPLSYGIGTQVESPLGVLSVSIGLPKGEPIEQAKFHFGLIKQF